MKENNKRISFSIQSNLVELPKDFIPFIEEYKVGISTSLDGPAYLHNQTRPYLNGTPSFEKILKNAKKIMKVQNGMNVISVITKYNVNDLNCMLDLFQKEGFTSWQTTPVERSNSLSPDPLILGKNYISLFEQIFTNIQSNRQKIKVRSLLQYLSSLTVHSGIDACRSCSSGNFHPLLAIDYEGSVYPCDYFWGNKELQIGNVINERIKDIINSPKNLRMRDINKTKCFDCEWKNNCGGGCLANNYNDKNFSYCETQKMIYDYFSKKMPFLIKSEILFKILKDSPNGY